MEIDYWIANSGSFIHQIFMIVMGVLYALAYIFGVSYKAMNIYCYFILYPLSFSLFLKGWKKFIILPLSLLFFMIPNFEELSVKFFDMAVVFLNNSAEIFSSDYITMSVYLCVAVPIILYLPFILLRFGTKKLLLTVISIALLTSVYLLTIYPRVEPLLNTYF